MLTQQEIQKWEIHHKVDFFILINNFIMTLLTEEQREALAAKWVKAPFVNETCIWCGACVAIAFEVFELDDTPATVKSLENYEWLWVDDAISACPVSAISWKE